MLLVFMHSSFELNKLIHLFWLLEFLNTLLTQNWNKIYDSGGVFKVLMKTKGNRKVTKNPETTVKTNPTKNPQTTQNFTLDQYEELSYNSEKED